MPVASLKMWYTLIRPTLAYAVGIWGIYRWPEAERIQLELGRLILGVSGKTASDVIRGELGLWTMEGRLHFVGGANWFLWIVTVSVIRSIVIGENILKGNTTVGAKRS